MPKKPPKKTLRPPQHQSRNPGREKIMQPSPQYMDFNYIGSEKLKNKVAIITGGDSGIGRAVAIAFAKEGADIVIAYYDEYEDAKETAEIVLSIGKSCLILAGDIKKPSFCRNVVNKTIHNFKKLDILVNNAAQQYPQENFSDITKKQLESTFQTNVFGYFYMIKYALPHLKKGSSIINSSSVTAYRGSGHLIDYSATKGAIVSLTRSLATNLIEKGIRVNAVAPGPIWTPLIPSTFSAQHVARFGSDSPMKRAGEPKEIAPSYVFLASDDSSFMSGQVLHPNGGEIING